MINITTFINSFTFDDDSLPTLIDKVKSLIPSFEASIIKNREESSVMEFAGKKLHHIKNCISANLENAIKLSKDYGADMTFLISTYSQLAIIVDSELSFCESFGGIELRSNEQEEILPNIQTIETPMDSEEGEIKGVEGLAKALNIGKNKAQAILASKILTDRGIAHKLGTWHIDRKGLKELLKKEPMIFNEIVCKR